MNPFFYRTFMYFLVNPTLMTC